MLFSLVIHSSAEFTPYPLTSSSDRFYRKLIDICVNKEKFNCNENKVKKQTPVLYYHIFVKLIISSVQSNDRIFFF